MQSRAVKNCQAYLLAKSWTVDKDFILTEPDRPVHGVAIVARLSRDLLGSLIPIFFHDPVHYLATR